MSFVQQKVTKNMFHVNITFIKCKQYKTLQRDAIQLRSNQYKNYVDIKS